MDIKNTICNRFKFFLILIVVLICTFGFKHDVIVYKNEYISFRILNNDIGASTLHGSLVPIQNKIQENDDLNVTDSNHEFDGDVKPMENNIENVEEKNEEIYIKEKLTENKNNYKNGDGFEGLTLDIYFTENNNIYTNVKIGNQILKLSLNSRLEGMYVFMNDSISCYQKDENNKRKCYDPSFSETASWCNNNMICLPAILSIPYECYADKKLNINNKVVYPNIYYDALKYSESHLEGFDTIELMDLKYVNKKEGAKNDENNNGENKSNNLNVFENADIKLIVDLSIYNNWDLFKDTDGIMGLAGNALSCRNTSIWNKILEKNNFLFGIDINLSENSTKKYVNNLSEKNKRNINFYNVMFENNDMNNKLNNTGYVTNLQESVVKLFSSKRRNITTEGNQKNVNPIMLNKEMLSSEIHIGDYKKEYEPILWSEPRERGGIFSDSFIQFTIYNLEVCDNNIFGKNSSNWQGVIDLSSKCLVLPKMFWLSLMQYLPVNKNDERCIPTNKEIEFNEDTIPRMCSIDDKYRPLPVLKFSFSDNDIVSNNNINNSDHEHGEKKKIHIPLDNLIIKENGPNNNYLCIIPDVREGTSNGNSGRTTKPLIKLGTYVLNNFYVVVDQENYRVGFSNKKSFYYSNDKCTQKVECIGDQIYEPALNICIDPDCSIWYFYTLNPETKTCESVSSRFYIFIIILIILLILDIQSYYLYRRSVRTAKISSR
ncbi:conserved Plasmodium protein, unknown function [Plasmodium berghei]|uniref:Peptidase n=1 Tax=Plasmodium berghei TaxID=5821 RepID=A0A0Y9UPJ4_PLABE|nr:conserved Plasmodium protein, unknown function [Plasmodium berghei]SCM17455.1 conserved Plasmodium protein, unknown function [Plasmodium berghei]